MFTAAYIFLIFVFFARKSPEEQIWKLAPNEMGDTLAGIAGPLAFVWLFLGFFIQSKQLQAQGESVATQQKAIEMQREDLAHQRSLLELQKVETARLADETELQRRAIELSAALSRRDALFRNYDLICRQLEQLTLQALVPLLRSLKTPNGDIIATGLVLSEFDRSSGQTTYLAVANYMARLPKEHVMPRLEKVPRLSERMKACCDEFEVVLDLADEVGGSSQSLRNALLVGNHAVIYAAFCGVLGRGTYVIVDKV